MPPHEPQANESVAPQAHVAAGSSTPTTSATADWHRITDPGGQGQTTGHLPFDRQAEQPRPSRSIDRRRILLAVAVLLVIVVPGAAVAVAGLNPGLGKGWNALILLVTGALVAFLFFLLFVYVVAYVVSAAWHDAQNHRRHTWR